LSCMVRADFRGSLWPAQSRAKVVFCSGERICAEHIARRLFGRRLATWQYASLAGAPDAAMVEVGTYNGGLYLELSDPMDHEYHGVWLIERQGGHLTIINDGFHIHRPVMQRRGIGLRIFARQLHTATAFGVKHIRTRAGRRGGENGYYTWPRFGFDGPLPEAIRPKLPIGLEHARTVLDLMECEKGRLWWREHGVTIDVVFDTGSGSRSRRTFARYLAG